MPKAEHAGIFVPHPGATSDGDRPMTTSTARADALIAPEHPFRRHLQRVADLDRAQPLRPWTPADGPIPALFLGHGAPATFENVAWMNEMHDWARKLPKPTAILIVSAHWESA